MTDYQGPERRTGTRDTYRRAVDAARGSEGMRITLTFVVAGEVYGLAIAHLREIIKVREVTEVPRMPRFLLGVISVRGLIIPVLDLRRRLNLDETALTRAARILVVEQDGEPHGLLVDAVTDVVRFVETEIESPPSTLNLAEQRFVSGIGRYQSGRRTKMVVLLQLAAVLGFDVQKRRAEGA